MKPSSVPFAIPILLAAACGTPDAQPVDVVGPFTGGVQRFVIDKVTLPTSVSLARQFADDLDGDKVVDNQAGMVVGTLVGQGDGNLHATDMIASGILASFVEIQADDLTTDDAAGVRYLDRDGGGGEQLGGTFVDGVFTSNRTRTTRRPIDTLLRLPVFADADPIAVRIVGTEIDLVPDGRGGYDGSVRGGILAAEAIDAAAGGILQMIDANPRDHIILIRGFDANHDSIISRDEIAKSTLVRSLLAPDIQLFQDGSYAPNTNRHVPDAVSLGFGIHIAPCAAGNCALAKPANTCFDRVLDAGETALDCGAGCALKCPTAAACNVPADCQSGGCDAGHCRAPTCTDGIADGLESDVDCGIACPTKCALGQACEGDGDCASGKCSGFFGGGVCEVKPP